MSMRLLFVDYSAKYYLAKIPSKRRGKFVLMQGRDAEYLVVAPIELCSWHANIVERFLNERQVAGDYTTRERDHYELYDADWNIAGGGYWEIDERQQRLHLFGQSTAYGRFINDNLHTRVAALGEFHGFDILIE